MVSLYICACAVNSCTVHVFLKNKVPNITNKHFSAAQLGRERYNVLTRQQQVVIYIIISQQNVWGERTAAEQVSS